jgi:integrase
MRKEDRHLKKRGNRYWYVRGVPRDVQLLDHRSPLVQQTLRTSSIHTAREKRDVIAMADDEMWDALRSGIDATTARQRYDASLKLHHALRFKPMTAAEIRDDFNDPKHYGPGGEVLTVPEIMRRPLEAVRAGVNYANSEPVQAALAGEVPKPETTVREAFDDYITDLCANDWLQKSEGQVASSTKPKRRAIENFCKVVANKAVKDINRDDALRFYKHWQGRMVAGDIGYSTANRDLDNMRVLWRWHNSRSGNGEGRNPFDGLSFKKPRHIKRRVSYTPEFTNANFLTGDKLSAMGEEARRALLVIIGTGCRPSEVINIAPENIVLDGPIPHLKIRDIAGRELKTSQSNRDVPLVGLALAAMQAHVASGAKGFPRYKDKDTNFSAVMMGHFRRHGLRETDEHSVYCFRHSFEDALKDAGLDSELRRELMGHRIDRSEYGRGFSLEAKAESLERALSIYHFDPAVI